MSAFPGDCNFENPLNPLCSWEIVPGDLKFLRVKGKQNKWDGESEDRDRGDGSSKGKGRRAGKEKKSRGERRGERGGGRRGERKEGRRGERKGERRGKRRWRSKRPDKDGSGNESKPTIIFHENLPLSLTTSKSVSGGFAKGLLIYS